jgi:hypothetical protein
MTLGGVVAAVFVAVGALCLAEGIHLLVRGGSTVGYLWPSRRRPLSRLLGLAFVILAVALFLFPWGAPDEAPPTRGAAMFLLLVANGPLIAVRRRSREVSAPPRA